MKGQYADSDCGENAHVKSAPKPYRRSEDRLMQRNMETQANPEPDARRHGGQTFTLRGSRQSQIARRADATYTSRGKICPHQWMLNYKSWSKLASSLRSRQANWKS